MTNKDEKIAQLFEGDPRAEVLYEEIERLLYEYGKRMPIPTILGVIRLIEHGLIQEQSK